MSNMGLISEDILTEAHLKTTWMHEFGWQMKNILMFGWWPNNFSVASPSTSALFIPLFYTGFNAGEKVSGTRRAIRKNKPCFEIFS